MCSQQRAEISRQVLHRPRLDFVVVKLNPIRRLDVAKMTNGLEMTPATNLKDQPPFRLIILGAGFSQPARLPLGDELLELTRRRIGLHSKALEDEIEQWRHMYPEEQISLERVLAYSHHKHYLGLQGANEWHSHGSVAIVQARRAIQEILTEAMPERIPEVYRDFASRLTPHDTIITFNYDTLLERALDAIGKPYSLAPEWWLSEPHTEEGLSHVNLLKVHGSVDWYDRKPYDDYMSEQGQYYDKGLQPQDPIFGPNPRVRAEPLLRGRPDKEMGKRIIPRVVRVPDYRELLYVRDELNRGFVVPFMLPLAHDKILGHEPVLDFWWSLQRIVGHETSSITMIGYSMPKHDQYAYEAIGAIFMEYQKLYDTKATFMLEHTRKPIQIINKAESAQAIMEDLPFMDSSKSRIWHRGFSPQSITWAFG